MGPSVRTGLSRKGQRDLLGVVAKLYLLMVVVGITIIVIIVIVIITIQEQAKKQRDTAAIQ